MQIQPFSVNDGDGIRTNIFIAGCPLRCRWCSNPEGFEQKELVGWHRRKCIGCGACASVCPQGIGIDMSHPAINEADSSLTGFRKCTACGACVSICPEGARTGMVKMMDADEIIQQIHRHRLFFSYSGGGVTFSGGEATSQPELLDYLSAELYDMGYSLAIETCGLFDFERIRPILERMDLVFMDLKHMDPDIHRKYTGVSNEKILSNIAKLGTLGSYSRIDHAKGSAASFHLMDQGHYEQTPGQSGPEVVIRIPVVGGVNNDEENIRRSAAYVHKVLPQARMELLPYHRLGAVKYEAIGLPFEQDELYPPSESEMEALREVVRLQGVELEDYR